MATTNMQLIATETARLISENIIGQEDCIHTYERWLSLGYQVQRGEKAITHIIIWKPIKRVRKRDGVEEQKMIMKNSAFFSSSQVQPIEQ